jgi:hypothetical protein
MAQPLEMYLSYFSHPLMIILIFHRIIINLLVLYRLPYFVFCFLVFLCPTTYSANFVIGLWAVKFTRIKKELNWIIIIIIIIISKYL